MKLYYSPGACSIGIHVLLEEIGKPYEAQAVSSRDGETRKPPFIDLNPKGKVPTLQRDDGSVLTEFPAIATWLARTNPDAHLLPSDADAEAHALEAMEYAVSTLHMQAFSRIFRPSNFASNEADQAAVKERGMQMFRDGLAILDRALAGRDYIGGQFSIGDAALFYVEFWWAGRLKQELPPNCAAHYARMLARPSVQKVLAAEGLAA
jgi:glutathione S-transferase